MASGIIVNNIMSLDSSLFISKLLAQCKSNQSADILSTEAKKRPFSSSTPENYGHCACDHWSWEDVLSRTSGQRLRWH